MIGVGAAAALVLAVLAFFGWTWAPWDRLLSLPASIPALSVTYVLGIVLDRIADRLFRPIDRTIRSKHFASSDTYYQAKDDMYSASEAQRTLQEYGRSRLRICRAWTLAWLGIALVLGLIALKQSLAPHLARLALVGSASCLILACATFFAWRSITESNCKQLAKPWIKNRKSS